MPLSPVVRDVVIKAVSVDHALYKNVLLLPTCKEEMHVIITKTIKERSRDQHGSIW